MNADIILRGQTTSPHDLIAPDGDLALSINMLHQKGMLSPIPEPSTRLNLEGRGLDVVYIHETHSYHNYIARHEAQPDMLLWLSEDGTTTTELRAYKAIKKIVHLGNTLIVLDSKGLHYSLFKDNKYHYLGDRLPDITLSLGLQGEYVCTNIKSIQASVDANRHIQFDTWVSPNLILYGNDIRAYIRTKEHINEILGLANKFVAEEAHDKDKFMFPFFVRYALRLYDGSLVKHSAPILMMPNSGVVPYLHLDAGVEVFASLDFSLPLRAGAMLTDLDYALSSDKAGLGLWSDIVKGIAIFVSSPIYTYDQSAKEAPNIIARFDQQPNNWHSLVHINPGSGFPSNYIEGYRKHSITEILNFTHYRRSSGDAYTHYQPLPSFDEDELYKRIESVGTFFHLEDIPLDKLSKERQVLKLPKGTLATLSTREAMTDDLESHDTIIPDEAFVYNSRLHLSGIKRKIFEGFGKAQLLPHTSGDALTDIQHKTMKITYIANINGKEQSLGVSNPSMSIFADMQYLYHPNPNVSFAYVMMMHTPGDIRHYKVPMRRHDFLAGSYAFLGLGGERLEQYRTDGRDYASLLALDNEEPSLTSANMLYSSEVNNPFSFPAKYMTQVGTGRILGLATATKALSEGQYGQFPLYVFSTEGVWALELSNNGVFTAKHPVSRDVCINPASITQIDTAVLFTTERGIMLLEGSRTLPISEVMQGEPCQLGKILSAKMLRYLERHSPLVTLARDVPDLRGEFLYECRMLYDYRHSRIIVYAPSHRLAYVYSLESHLWAMIESDIKLSIPSYPETLAMSHSGKLLDYAKDEGRDSPPTHGLVLTRPYTLDQDHIHKTIDTLIVRGEWDEDCVASLLFGTRDYKHWHLINTSIDHRLFNHLGTPYKAFRTLILSHMKPHEALHSLSIAYRTKLTNQRR